MPQYNLRLSVPANTPERSPVQTTITVDEPLLERVEIILPEPGPGYLVSWRLTNRGSAIVPAYGSSSRWNRRSVKTDVGRTLEGPPYFLELSAFSDDRIEPHTLEAYVYTRLE